MSEIPFLASEYSRVTARRKWWCAVALVAAFAVTGGTCAAQAAAR